MKTVLNEAPWTGEENLNETERQSLAAGICPHCLGLRWRLSHDGRRLCVACHREYEHTLNEIRLVATSCPPDRLRTVYGIVGMARKGRRA